MLWVQGNAYATGSWSSSDAAFKKDISTIDNSLDKLMKVRGTRFEFRNDEFNGQGTLRFANGNRYTGSFSKNRIEGQGTLRYANGDEYTGEFVDGQRHGRGVYTYATGSKFTGEFREDQLPARVTYTYKNGDQYVGEFKDWRFHGKGKKSFANGRVPLDGLWEEGEFIMMEAARK